MSKADQKLVDGIDPIHVSRECWIYAEKESLAVVIEKRSPDGTVTALQSPIAWEQIEKAIAERKARFGS